MMVNWDGGARMGRQGRVVRGAAMRGGKLRYIGARYASVLAMAAAMGGVAHAQCAPNPSQAGQPIACAGTQSGGYTVTTDQSPLTLASGATIQNGGDALTVAIPASAYYAQRNATIALNGSVVSTGGSGIALQTGPAYPGNYDYAGTGATITLAAGASVTGINGISLAQTPGALSQYARLALSLNNAGTITANGGSALTGAGGTSFLAMLTNAGTITANGSAPTIAPGGVLTLTNTGTITNTGTGAALVGTALTITNATGATISAGSNAAAINASLWLNLANAGTINGDVVIASSYGANSIVDSSAGTLNGNLTFGQGNNTLIATVSNGAVVTGVTGTITAPVAPGTSNSFQLNTNANASLSSPIVVPANFQQLVLAPASSTTLTLANGFSSAMPLQFNGPGTLTNATSLGGNGQIIAVGFNAGLLNNTGTITSANAGGPGAVTLSGYGGLNNSGTISATGDAVTGYGSRFANSGTIAAGGSGVNLYVDGRFTNSGAITSNGGTALQLILSCSCSQASNTGTISGAGTGLAFYSGIFNNAGAITSSNYGVQLGSFNALNNLAGGVISGGAAAVVGMYQSYSLGQVFNAGTINGDVWVSGLYDALPGGVLNGNLRLGTGGTLITDLVNSGTGAFAGINGTVYATNAKLIYNVNADASMPATPAGFSAVTYQLANNATLTSAPTSALTSTLGLAGVGQVTLGGTISTQDATALDAQGIYAPMPPGNQTSALTITNRGTIAAQFSSATVNSFYGSPVAVALGSNTLVNSGTITGTAALPTNYGWVVLGGGSVTNSGTIQGNGLVAVSIGGSTQSPATLTNSGAITSDQTAVRVSGTATIVNSGRIASTGGLGISLNDYYSQATITNQAGGTISGALAAIQMSGGTVSNAGTINGTVDLNALAYGVLPPFYPGIYIANGGTLNGNLVLPSNGALEMDIGQQGTGPFAGVTGTITANGAALAYSVNADTTATSGAATPAGFGTAGYLIGNNATLTFAAASQQTTSLAVAGNGALVLNGAVSTVDAPALVSQAPALAILAPAQTGTANVLHITNNGTLAATATANWQTPAAVSLGASDSLVNTGTITLTAGTQPYYGGAVTGGASLTNAGTILGSNAHAVYSSGSVTNSGTIGSNLDAVTLTGPSSLTNSGTITSTGGAAISQLSTYAYFAPSLTNLAGGTITGAGDAITLSGGAISNAGTINGNITWTPWSGQPGVYIAAGGVLNGNLTFSPYSGGNELVETGAGLGVTGTISTGAGTNLYGHMRMASGAVTLGQALPAGFAREYAVALGAATQLTLQGDTHGGDIFVGGNGAIVNRIATSGTIRDLSSAGESYYTGQGLQLARLDNQAAVGSVAISASQLVNEGTIGTPGATTPVVSLQGSGPLAFLNQGSVLGGVAITGSDITLTDAAGASLTGPITIAPVTTGLSLSAPVAAATARIALAGAFAGDITAGAGANVSLTVAGGTSAQPIAFGALNNIASYEQTGGVASLSGRASLGAMAIDGGLFIGQLGSTVQAPLVVVGPGGAFQSGGMLVGNVLSAGTLHVGASPDTLTVQGNVTLAGGSTTVFEVTPTAASRLVASGAVTIADHATVQILATRPLAPGSRIDLINAAGGISGQFATVSGISGALVSGHGDLAVVALFDPAQAANPQVAGGVGYLNGLLASGAASPALIAALPAMQDAAGAPVSAAFARLTPQAYASATQIGVENGLMLSRAVRADGWETALRGRHWFAFGNALGNWRGLAGDGARGTFSANLSAYGLLGGLGVAYGRVSLAGFVGHVGNTQTIGALGASTEAAGTAAGLVARFAPGPVQLAVSLTYDGSHARTQRFAPDGVRADAAYALHSWTIDAQASADLALGSAFAARPHAGLTWVWTKRGGADEGANTPFALTVAGAHTAAGFVDAGLRLETRDDPVRRLTPFADMGVRYQVAGAGTQALAGIVGAPVGLGADGVRRAVVSGLAQAGVHYRATGAITLFATASGEASRDNYAGAVNGGVQVRF